MLSSSHDPKLNGKTTMKINKKPSPDLVHFYKAHAVHIFKNVCIHTFHISIVGLCDLA